MLELPARRASGVPDVGETVLVMFLQIIRLKGDEKKEEAGRNRPRACL
jgi:hypothetical protein